MRGYPSILALALQSISMAHLTYPPWRPSRPHRPDPLDNLALPLVSALPPLDLTLLQHANISHGSPYPKQPPTIPTNKATHLATIPHLPTPSTLPQPPSLLFLPTTLAPLPKTKKKRIPLPQPPPHPNNPLQPRSNHPHPALLPALNSHKPLLVTPPTPDISDDPIVATILVLFLLWWWLFGRHTLGLRHDKGVADAVAQRGKVEGVGAGGRAGGED